MKDPAAWRTKVKSGIRKTPNPVVKRSNRRVSVAHAGDSAAAAVVGNAGHSPAASVPEISSLGSTQGPAKS
ncbi:hypothetical protein BM221_003863 [Beauveria bassiana]|uniref:Uncharacterized protein n=1 Tax=Beauveria bassiana TaxID=176275 RepID=A0A2N6NPM9_BEABA|nr:hypothetical protein BM221_003863 [Beauveria bassiana]